MTHQDFLNKRADDYYYGATNSDFGEIPVSPDAVPFTKEEKKYLDYLNKKYPKSLPSLKGFSYDPDYDFGNEN